MNPEKEIRIDGLTEYQVELLDIMWSLDGEIEFIEWYDNLDHEDQVIADSLMRLIILELRDELLGDLSEARAVLKKFML